MEQTLLKRTVIFVNDAVFSNGVRIPMIGFGTYHATDELGQSVLEEALRCGYRSFDRGVRCAAREAVSGVQGSTE